MEKIKIKKNRKAMSNLNVLITLIIGLAILFTLVFASYNLYNVHLEKKQKMVCKEALRVNSATKILGSDSILELFRNPGDDISDVPCPVQYREVRGSPIEAKKQLANIMYDSWDKMHKGELELFSGKTGEETYCIVTDYIKFKGTPDIEGFSEFLLKETIPGANNEMTYADYLKCFNPTPDLFLAPDYGIAPKDEILTELDYGVMFLYAKKGHLHKVWSTGKGAATGAAVGIGAAILFSIPEPITTAAALVILGAGAGTGAGAGYILGEGRSADWQACIMLFPYTTETINSLNCTYMPGVQGYRGN